MSLLPNAFRIRDEFPFDLKRVIPVEQSPTKPEPVIDWSNAMPSDKPPKMVRLRLTEDFEAEADDFRRVHGDGNCSCFISAPCGSCTHPGNPLNLDCTDEAWVYGPEGDHP